VNGTGWRNDAIAGVEGALMVDGAKRDRYVYILRVGSTLRLSLQCRLAG